MKIVTKKLSELNIAPYNPRVDIMKDNVFYQKLYTSIKKFGYVEPIIWNKQTGNIVGGNQRLSVLLDTGMPSEEIECVQVDLSLSDEKALNVALNKISGDWDHDKLAMVFNDLKLDEYELDFTGFDSKEIDGILDEYNTIPDEETDVDVLVERESKYTVERGDIYKLGTHRLMCGDSTDSGDVKALVGDSKMDMVFTDPPYGVDYGGKNKFLNSIGKGNRIDTPIENDNIEDYNKFFNGFLKHFKNIMNDYNSFYITISGQKLLNLLEELRDLKYKASQILIWVKNNHVLGRQDYANKHELIIYGWINKHKFYGDFNTTTWEINKPQKSELHNTMKPIELMTKAIHNSSQHNNNIYDPFGGSGSTLIAAEQTNRNCYMMEIDPHYCSVIIERWEQLTGGKHEQWQAN